MEEVRAVLRRADPVALDVVVVAAADVVAHVEDQRRHPEPFEQLAITALDSPASTISRSTSSARSKSPPITSGPAAARVRRLAAREDLWEWRAWRTGERSELRRGDLVGADDGLDLVLEVHSARRPTPLEANGPAAFSPEGMLWPTAGLEAAPPAVARDPSGVNARPSAVNEGRGGEIAAPPSSSPCRRCPATARPPAARRALPTRSAPTAGRRASVCAVGGATRSPRSRRAPAAHPSRASRCRPRGGQHGARRPLPPEDDRRRAQEEAAGVAL